MRQSTSPISGSPISFPEAFQQLLSGQVLAQLWSQHGPKPRGQQPKFSRPQQLVCGLVFHVLSGVGRLAAHLQQLTGLRISDSALSQRRTAAGWEEWLGSV